MLVFFFFGTLSEARLTGPLSSSSMHHHHLHQCIWWKRTGWKWKHLTQNRRTNKTTKVTMYTLSRAQRTEQQRAATYYGLAGSPSLAIFVVYVFDPFSEALPIGFFSEALLYFRFFLKQLSFLGIINSSPTFISSTSWESFSERSVLQRRHDVA